MMATYKTDVAILGGGFAGSLAAAMLGRAGIDCVLADPHEIYPDDFRCEKIDGPQMTLCAKPVSTARSCARRRSTAPAGSPV